MGKSTVKWLMVTSVNDSGFQILGWISPSTGYNK